MRNLLGLGTPVVCGYCGQAPLSTGTAARLCASKPARALHTGPSGTLHTGGAWCPVGEPHGPTSGRKLSLFTRNGSIWRFFYMLGEFCTAHAVGRGVLGEFCTGSGPPLGPVAGLSRSWALGRGLPDPQVRSTTVAGGGFALHEALNRRVAGVSHPLVVQFPPSRGLPDERGTQNADHLGEKH